MLCWKYLKQINLWTGDSTEVFIDLLKNDDSYGIPHSTLTKNTSNQEDLPHLPEFSNKTILSISINVSW